jgi:Tol biopolymer transport system component
VVKNQLLDTRNEPVRLRGVNTACLEWTDDGEGHIVDTVKTAITEWHVNHIRLPMNQDRWFGKAPKQTDDGKSYRALVDQVVDLCTRHGCYVMLDLHWSDAGEWGKQIGQHVMPDQNSVTFWRDVATIYNIHPAVLFDLYNEPHDVSWDIWLKGGKVTERARGGNPAKTYEAVGMQTLLNAVRDTGAKNVVIAGGLNWAYDMSGFLEGKRLSDPAGNGVIYANHAYPFKGDTIEKWIAKMEKAAGELPVIVSEFGAEGRRMSGPNRNLPAEEWVRRVLTALEDRKWSWTAWDLHPAAGPRLISDWKYTPTPTFGKWVKEALLGNTNDASAGRDHPSPRRKEGARRLGEGTGERTPTAGEGEPLESRLQAVPEPAKAGTPTSSPSTPKSPSPRRGEGARRAGEGAGERTRTAGEGELLESRLQAVPGPAKAGTPTRATPGALGLFDDHQDIGTVLHRGTASFDPDKRAYTISASGENMWSTRDAFHYVWKKASGDLALTADVTFVGKGAAPHRKACLIIRQSLDPDSAYVDVALHGDGLTSLQFREARGAATHEVQSNLVAPKRLRIEKRGKYTLMYLAAEGQAPGYSGAAVRIALEEPYYVGLGVCSHNKDVTETAIFSNVELVAPAPTRGERPTLYSNLETQTIASTDRRVVYVTPARIEAPNWLRGDSGLIFNRGGRIYRIPIAGGTPQPIDTGFATRCNNDHGVSPDGTTLVISDQSQEGRQSLIYTLPISGGTPKRITKAAPSYWHGWSPDGATLAYCAERNGEFDIYTIPAVGGEETRLTTAPGLDDGPEYSPDGKFIYFNSVRTGLMQIWRMRPDGSAQEQVTFDDYNNWFPHLSPDGRRMVFLTYEKDVTGHPENKDVMLRMMTLDSKKIDVLGRFFGGQGTINVPSWSPDGRKIAFVSYQLVEGPRFESRDSGGRP